jgi:hypothetical protein
MAKGHPVITYQLREQIIIETTFESEDFFLRETLAVEGHS